ncbi:MAG: DegV family protein [Lachnospiraceae bacterium]|nr:DegV family protein [Lachnospiraceae bacterium]
MSVKIICDSASDISLEQAKEWGVTVLPLKTIWEGKEYLDGVTMEPHEFYERLIETDELPTTSQVTPYEFQEAFKQVIEEKNTAVCLTVSSKLSGTYQSALIANEEVDYQIELVDTLNVTLGEHILIKRAVELRDQGKSAQEIAQILNEEKNKVRVIALLDTLEYLKKGGRVSGTAAFAGSVLNIKPVVGVVDGQVEVLGKARGSKNGNNKLMEQISLSGGVDFEKPFVLGYSGLSDDLLQKYIVDSSHIYEEKTKELPIVPIGSSIGTHAGPGAIGVAFFCK